ncbi:LysM peptidoglycan-binding domain-containing protein [Marinobacterium sp. AK62]|uniref:LysM peptidoglycan-binding domain-containing protein n=1 Tax=Marinobacterium alkalitolerans TaxID=1542925 RepID=A0ABS3ZAR2_9GAMM|nr:LysM domain-containing protein [Marinobacterium alkalitolerans]MBP0048134.1 LysM peptidoglycan-binding domain-containing protein [Marinobacterium alkalitolerans]
MRLKHLWPLSLVAFAGILSAAPASYEVQRGDSLSSIAATHLGSADRWREIWALNPDIRQPEQLAVGMRLKLPTEGEPVKAETAPDAPAPPEAGTEIERPDPIQVMALDLIRSGHVDRVRRDYRLLDNTPNSIRIHAVRQEADGLHIYSDDLAGRTLQRREYGVFQQSTEPVQTQTLELKRVATARPALHRDNLASFLVTASNERPREDAMLLPLTRAPFRIQPSYPDQTFNARVAKALYEQPGGFLLVLEQGSDNGLQPGHLLRIEPQNPVRSEHESLIEYPSRPTGWAMIIDTSTSSSLALVMSAQQVPAVGDRLH